jgi:sigma-E factor negative regulatory protein RseC
VIEESARVVRLEGEYAWVETHRRGSCGNCSAEKGCGTSAMNKLFNPKPVRVKAHNRIGARPDDMVIVGLQDAALVRGSMVVYLLPLLVMIACAIVARAFGGGDGLVALAGMAGLALGFLAVRGFGRRAAENPLYQAVVLRHSDTLRGAPLQFIKK